MRTEIASIGKFELMERVAGGAGEDCLVSESGKGHTLVSTRMMLEGIDFDLIYTPLKHLGYKAVVAALARVYAMNGTPRRASVTAGLSAKFSVEQAEELYAGAKAACEKYGVTLAGGDISASMTGLAISVTVAGDAEKVVGRGGASNNDLICVSGNLGAAYMGLQLLEREKRALQGVDNPSPEFAGREYILRRQLMPQARRDITEALAENRIVPTSMICLSEGLAAGVMHICKSSGVGARIYLDRVPIAKETFEMAREMNIDPVVAALNGGDDYEVLFTVPVAMQKEVMNIPGIDITGHIVPQSKGAALVTPDGEEIPLQAQGFN